MLDIENRNCLVIGAGNVALRKISSLISYGANVSVISREVCPELEALGINQSSKEYKPELIEGNFLVIAATDDADLNTAIYKDCVKRNIMVNVVDKPELCGFILPAVYQEGDLTISVSTGGKSPMMSKLIRDELKNNAAFLDVIGKLRLKAKQNREILLGTRGSRLALKQAEIVISELKKYYPEMIINIKTFKTTGDKMPDVPLDEIQQDDVFTKELDAALLNNEIDLAVHSLKDVPDILPGGLRLTIFPKKEDPRDVLISRNNLSLRELPEGSVIGTSSARRTEQVKSLRPDLEFFPIRGNIDERIKKVENGQYDATILAAAGLNRLGLQGKIAEYFDIKKFPTAPGQGALAIVTGSEIQ